MNTSLNNPWLAVCFALLLSPAALSQDPIHEDFESYSPGPLDGQGHWIVNDNNATTVGSTSGPSGVLTQVVEQTPNADSACAFADVTTAPIDDGQWLVTISIMVESGFDGESQLSLANQLGAPAPDDWFLHIRLNGNAGLLFCDCGSSTVQVPLVVDQWATLRVIVSLPSGGFGDVRLSVYYLEQLVSTFFTLPLMNPEVGGIQLTTTPGGNPNGSVAFDNLEVIRLPAGEPGLRRCFGDGSVTPCPCGNTVPSGTVTGCKNSTGLGARLSASGTASLFAGDLVLAVTGAVPFQPSVFIQGEETVGGGFGLPFGDGLRCCGSQVVRLQTVFPGASGTAVIGVDGAATSAFPGDFKCYQFWYRDPFGSCGSGFNLSNAYELYWQP